MIFRLTTILLFQLVARGRALRTSFTRAQRILDQDIIVRQAVEEDLDDVVTIFLDAFSPGPVWKYLYTQLDDYYDFTWHCMRRTIGEEFAHKTNTTFANVIQKPRASDDADQDSSGPRRAVAFAAWNIIAPEDNAQHQSASIFGSLAALTKCSEHPEMNQTRARDYARQAMAIERDYIFNRKEDQLYLSVLATHPRWDGHGFAAAHLKWGLHLAQHTKENLPITLLATPAGWPLYNETGLESVKNVTITTLDNNLDDLWYEYMRFGNFGRE